MNILASLQLLGLAWFSMDATLLFAILFGVTIIKPLCPQAWKAHVCDYAPTWAEESGW